jgi:hypothetical protein
MISRGKTNLAFKTVIFDKFHKSNFHIFSILSFINLVIIQKGIFRLKRSIFTKNSPR